ncbi:MAG: DNA polymerase III subunit [Paludibacteraceae bacterium]
MLLFSNIIGQQVIKERFIRSVKEQRIPHAQLLYGDEGVGKLALAVAYAQYICCENRTETDSCGVCPSCVKYKQLAHPDLHFVFPVIKPPSKSTVICDDFLKDFRNIFMEDPYFGLEDWYERIGDGAKQGMIYSNESSEIIRKLSLKTYESEYKVMIIWMPELMHESCANKLLKILEEPPAYTVFLLVSNNPDANLTTILSRTQQVKIPRLSEPEIASALSTSYQGTDATEIQNVARISEGSFLKAGKLLNERREMSQNFERFVEIMRKAWMVGNKKDHASLKTLKKWSEDMASADVGRERQKKFLSYAQHMVRENYIFNLHLTDLNYITDYETNFSRNFSPFINERNVEELMTEFALAERHIEQNTNAKMVFFDLVLKVIMLLKR